MLLIPLSLLLILGCLTESIKPVHDPWYLIAVLLLMGLLGQPLALGLLLRRAFALLLFYAMFVITIQAMALEVVAWLGHSHGLHRDELLALTEFLVMWSLSVVYYRKRRIQLK